MVGRFPLEQKDPPSSSQVDCPPPFYLVLMHGNNLFFYLAQLQHDECVRFRER